MGMPVGEVIRRVGISEQTFYRWKKQFTGLEIDQVRQLKHLQDENGRLKRLVAELTLDRGDVTGRAAKKLVKPSRSRAVVSYLRGAYPVSELHACEVAWLPRATNRYQSIRDPLAALRMRLRELAQSRDSIRLPQAASAADP
jgi:putative transposase